jgi:hypothetical protein
MLALFLFVISILLFLLAAFQVPEPSNPWHNRLVCFGLMCLAGAELASKMPGLIH